LRFFCACNTNNVFPSSCDSFQYKAELMRARGGRLNSELWRTRPMRIRHHHNSNVKASNFGPHGNFGHFLASSVASVDESCTKNEQSWICRSKVFLQLFFSSFVCRTRFHITKHFWKRGPKFQWGPNLGALTVLSSLCSGLGDRRQLIGWSSARWLSR
jgi:hypothetical protein